MLSIDATWEKGPLRNAQELATMVNKCGDCVVKCVQDEKCKECLSALTAIDTRDQVASYRTIVSYESDLLRDFTFCILQKNNIFNCEATIPEIPKVQPVKTWRGRPLTREDGRAILVGHLDDEDAPEVSLDACVRLSVGASTLNTNNLLHSMVHQTGRETIGSILGSCLRCQCCLRSISFSKSGTCKLIL